MGCIPWRRRGPRGSPSCSGHVQHDRGGGNWQGSDCASAPSVCSDRCTHGWRLWIMSDRGSPDPLVLACCHQPCVPTLAPLSGCEQHQAGEAVEEEDGQVGQLCRVDEGGRHGARRDRRGRVRSLEDTTNEQRHSKQTEQTESLELVLAPQRAAQKDEDLRGRRQTRFQVFPRILRMLL